MMSDWEPAYLDLLPSGELARRVERAYGYLEACVLCGHECGVDRYQTVGVCRTGEKARVASYGAHHGEEDPLRGRRGSGTIFFAWCNLSCQFCQNYDISQSGHGRDVSPEALAAMMLELQERGCHNVNFVSPSHVVPQILAATLIAAQAGLRLPLVYNTGGYDSLLALELLDGVIDIYMPDCKYADPEVARNYSKAPDYPAVNQAAVKEMHRQVGDLVVDVRGVARRGLLVRHLVMPNDLAGTAQVARFLAQEVSPDTYFNLMGQYRPCYNASDYPALNRSPTHREMVAARQAAEAAGLRRFDQRRSRLAWL